MFPQRYDSCPHGVRVLVPWRDTCVRHGLCFLLMRQYAIKFSFRKGWFLGASGTKESKYNDAELQKLGPVHHAAVLNLKTSQEGTPKFTCQESVWPQLWGPSCYWFWGPGFWPKKWVFIKTTCFHMCFPDCFIFWTLFIHILCRKNVYLIRKSTKRC